MHNRVQFRYTAEIYIQTGKEKTCSEAAEDTI